MYDCGALSRENAVFEGLEQSRYERVMNPGRDGVPATPDDERFHGRKAMSQALRDTHETEEVSYGKSGKFLIASA
jgi:hypothetical protein